MQQGLSRYQNNLSSPLSLFASWASCMFLLCIVPIAVATLSLALPWLILCAAKGVKCATSLPPWNFMRSQMPWPFQACGRSTSRLETCFFTRRMSGGREEHQWGIVGLQSQCPFHGPESLSRLPDCNEAGPTKTTYILRLTLHVVVLICMLTLSMTLPSVWRRCRRSSYSSPVEVNCSKQFELWILRHCAESQRTIAHESLYHLWLSWWLMVLEMMQFRFSDFWSSC